MKTGDRTAVVQPRTLRVKDAQRVLGLGKTKIHELIRDGRLATVRIDGARLIPVEAIEALLANATGKADQSGDLG